MGTTTMAFNQRKTTGHRTRLQTGIEKHSNLLFEQFKKQQAEQAEKKQEKEAKKAAALVSEEKEKKGECIEYERGFMMKGNSTEQIMLTDRPKQTTFRTISVGDYVEVKPDLSPNKCSYGGFGYITKDNKNQSYTVKYAGTEKGRTTKKCEH